ncbi:hypothetical protein Plhal304r1_c018g0063891 [Plasmopara halstedii]
MPYFCANPLATKRALYRSISPSWFFLMRKTHLLPIALRPCGSGTSSHVLFLRSDSISISQAITHLLASLDSIADLNVVGISPTESTTKAASKSCAVADNSSSPSFLLYWAVRFTLGASAADSCDCVRWSRLFPDLINP